MSVRDKTYELAKSITATKEFTDLQNAKKQIDKIGNLKERVKRFSKKQTAIYKCVNPKDAEQLIKDVNAEYKELSNIPEMKRFFKAGKAFNAMMSDIYKQIGSSLDSFLD